MTKRNLIIDCDTGIDDMVALIWASRREEFNLIGVVAVAGNQTVDKTLINNLNCMQALNNEVPVFRGSDRPLKREQVTASDFHGKSGLNGPIFPPLTKQAEKIGGVDFILQQLQDKKVTLVALGPLTDIAKVIQRASERELQNIEEIVIMGSTFCGGNVTEVAEFNTYADPEAAQIVYSSRLPLALFSLDVTHQATVDPDLIDKAKAMGTEPAMMFALGLEKYIEAYHKHGQEIAFMHDPCCIAYLLHPELFRGEYHSVSVKLDDKKSDYGQSVITGDGTIYTVNKLKDLDAYWNYYLDNLSKYN